MAAKTTTRLIKAPEVAARLGEHLETVRKRTRRGEFAAFVVNLGTERRPVWRYDEARLEAWIDSRRAA